MNTQLFSKQIAQLQDLTSRPLTCFTGVHYPTLFFGLMKKQLRQSITCKAIDVTEVEPDQVVGQLSMSFLGDRSLFWLLNVQDLDAKRKKELLNYLKDYSGPNAVILFVPPDLWKGEAVELPELVDQALFCHLFSFLYADGEKKAGFATYLFKKYPQLPLDTACLLMEYGLVLGSQIKPFIDEWLGTIVLPEQSLFVLSTHFFAKNKKAFFGLWHSIKDEYPEPFWTTYWSEQLYRAFGYIHYAQTKQFLKAKKMAYRLPFSFIQKDWKRVKADELKQAHHFMYSIDWNVKNSLPNHFELFFLKFFLGEFN